MPKGYHDLAVQAGLHQGVNDQKLLKYSQLIVKQCKHITLQASTTYVASERIEEHFKHEQV
jgi:hypothetical protein